MSKVSPGGRSWLGQPNLDLIASQTRFIIRNFHTRQSLWKDQRGDLLLRDMGYFSLSEFTVIE